MTPMIFDRLFLTSTVLFGVLAAALTPIPNGLSGNFALLMLAAGGGMFWRWVRRTS